LFNKKEVKDYFFPRIWVCMSAQPGDDPGQKIAILKRMLESLGVEEETINKYKVDQEHNLKELLYALHLQLQGKRYLIVFDDARGGEIGEEGTES
jgi:pyrroloquinoline quinone (PQQ) biosynthesis protein C